MDSPIAKRKPIDLEVYASFRGTLISSALLEVDGRVKPKSDIESHPVLRIMP